MRKKDVIRFLRNADDETIEQISRDYPVLSDTERDELFYRIERELHFAQPNTNNNVNKSYDEEQYILTNKRHSPRIFPATYAVVCMLVLCGTFAVQFLMRSRLEPELTESKYAYNIGESYAADNLTKSGKLLVTVTSAETDGELYHVCVMLKSNDAVSISDETTGEPYLFMADNFMAATEQAGENWVTVQPCKLEYSGEQGEMPNTIILRPDEVCELELWFKKNGMSDEWKLVTNNSTVYPYTIITIKEN